MYKKAIDSPRMTANEAAEYYPDNYILMRMDSKDLLNRMGVLLYTGDDGDELFSLLMKLNDPSSCSVIEGINHRRSLGGVVAGV